jgi:hypothetical protein
VELAAGAHEVHFSYRQPGLAGGAALSGLGLLLCGMLPAAAAWRRRRAATAGPDGGMA